MLNSITPSSQNVLKLYNNALKHAKISENSGWIQIWSTSHERQIKYGDR